VAFLLFLSQVQVEFQVQEEVEGCRRAVLRVLTMASPTIAAGQIYFDLTEELLVDYHLYCINYLKIFLYSSIRTNWDRYLT